MTKKTTARKAREFEALDISAMHTEKNRSSMSKPKALALALHSNKHVTKQSVQSAIERAAPYVEQFKIEREPIHAEKPTSIGNTRSMCSAFENPMTVATMLYAFQTTPAKLVDSVWKQSAGGRAAIYTVKKLVALAQSIVAGDAIAAWSPNSYTMTIVAVCEALGLSEIENLKVYDLYQSNRENIAAWLGDTETAYDFKKYMLQKAPSTGSTQRASSAELLQLLGAATNAGNERMIYVNRESENWQRCKALLVA